MERAEEISRSVRPRRKGWCWTVTEVRPGVRVVVRNNPVGEETERTGYGSFVHVGGSAGGSSGGNITRETSCRSRARTHAHKQQPPRPGPVSGGRAQPKGECQGQRMRGVGGAEVLREVLAGPGPEDGIVAGSTKAGRSCV